MQQMFIRLCGGRADTIPSWMSAFSFGSPYKIFWYQRSASAAPPAVVSCGLRGRFFGHAHCRTRPTGVCHDAVRFIGVVALDGTRGTDRTVMLLAHRHLSRVA